MTDTSAQAPSPTDHAALGALCDHLAALAATLPGPLGRVSLSLGSASVEVGWHDPAAAPAVLVAPAAAPPPAAVPVGVPHLAAAPAPVDALPDAHHQVTAPLVGTFYAAPSPGAPAFVALGEAVEVGQTLGIVEAMKLMNPIVSDVAGVLVAVLVADGQSVEFDQPLVVVDEGASTREHTSLAKAG